MLESFNLGLNHAHLAHGDGALVRERPEDNAHEQGEQDNRHAVVRDERVEEVKDGEQDLAHPREETEVHHGIRVRAERREVPEFLGSEVEPRNDFLGRVGLQLQCRVVIGRGDFLHADNLRGTIAHYAERRRRRHGRLNQRHEEPALQRHPRLRRGKVLLAHERDACRVRACPATQERTLRAEDLPETPLAIFRLTLPLSEEIRAEEFALPGGQRKGTRVHAVRRDGDGLRGGKDVAHLDAIVLLQRHRALYRYPRRQRRSEGKRVLLLLLERIRQAGRSPVNPEIQEVAHVQRNVRSVLAVLGAILQQLRLHQPRTRVGEGQAHLIILKRIELLGRRGDVLDLRHRNGWCARHLWRGLCARDNLRLWRGRGLRRECLPRQIADQCNH